MKSVYILQANGLIKIGVSKNPERRRLQIMNASGLAIELVDSFEGGDVDAQAVEFRAHQILKDHRRLGEWFQVSAADAIEAVKEAAKGIAAFRGRDSIPENFIALLAVLRGGRSREAFSKELGVSYWSLAGWEKTGLIPSRRWDRILEIAAARGRGDINWELLNKLHAKRAESNPRGRPKKAQTH